jgi:hypothetical protein
LLGICGWEFVLAKALHERAIPDANLIAWLVLCMSGHNALVCGLRFLACYMVEGTVDAVNTNSSQLLVLGVVTCIMVVQCQTLDVLVA